MQKRSRSHWFDRGLLTISGLGLVVDLTLPRERLGKIALLLFGVWCVRRVLAHIDGASEQFDHAFRLGQEVERRRIVLDGELAPVRELVRRQDGPAPATSSCAGQQVIELTPRLAANPSRTRANDDPVATAIVMATVRARRRRHHHCRP